MKIVALNQDEIKVVSAGVSLVGFLSFVASGVAGCAVSASFDRFCANLNKHRRLSVPAIGVTVMLFSMFGMFIGEYINGKFLKGNRCGSYDAPTFGRDPEDLDRNPI